MKKLKQTQTQFCKKILFKETAFDKSPTILFGIVTDQDSNFIFFRTANRSYQISKNCVLTIEDTTKLFREGN